MKKVLIFGKNSYIGESVENHLKKYPDEFEVSVADSFGDSWKSVDFSVYDTVFCVAGIAHDAGKKKIGDELYYKINRDLAVAACEKARDSGVKQFVFMSSLLIYGGCKEKHINGETVPKVRGVYGDSKLQADLSVCAMNSESFKTAVLRPPMIFGASCKGNFPRLVGLSKLMPVFPKIKNRRSMLYIENLAEFVRLIISENASGVFFPQDADYYCTSTLVKEIRNLSGKKIWLTRLLNPAVWLAYPLLRQVRKMFGDLAVDKNLSNTFGGEYILTNNDESIKKTCE